MKIVKFEINRDMEKVRRFLTECYQENRNMSCWLPERFDDLIYRLDALRSERKQSANRDFIYYWEDNKEIVAIILPDGDSFNTSIKTGYEYLFPEMLNFGEKQLSPLFEKDENGDINFLVVSHDSLRYQSEELVSRGYQKQGEEDYDNVQTPLETNYKIEMPFGYKQVYGYTLDDNRKTKACYFGFNPEDDDGILEGCVSEGALPYQARKASLFYKDSFESLAVTDHDDICSYSFCYVDRITKTAFIEPVCTREKYRHKGLCRQMLYGVIIKLKDIGIEKAYINSYAWRKKVYNSVGFKTEDSIGFWTKKL